MSKDNSNKDRENIFEILDGIMFQLSRTKKMFLIMIITTLIIPPLSIIAITSVYDSPYQDKFREDFDTRLQSKLDNDEITEDEYNLMKEKFSKKTKLNPLLRPPQLVIFVISVVWLGIGIRQWFVISKWDKRYQQFKEKQKEIDKKFEDDSDDEK
ncbi:hypothetical protein NZNM25_14190 [Nitrosopumilus zosterae]|uniref:SHOCT domain-containing protein n=1 Tax=Nitrosopumilus zosterae TaxID=718286 RepID=A0A2S2KT42_9ARCH|nr:hypothetical protein [Nitrosopumilus zosterae]BDQ30757.1 hypothetical protein NZOSNM25_000863 [Nitrosopumilus zosterae]GBH34628.1 hypothetical protein NZNM25_14190 [Nitrosopumilus zosterae]